MVIYYKYNKAQWNNLKTFLKLLGSITGHLLFSFICLFMHLFIYFFIYLSFNVNKFLLTFYNLSLLKLFSHTEAVSQRRSPGERCFVSIMWILGCAFVHECDSSKVTKRLCWDHASERLFSCGFASYLYSVFVGEHLLRTASEHK